MLSLFLSMMRALNFLCSPAYADAPPEPAEESTDTSTKDTAEGAEDEESGCNSTGMNVRISMLPIICIGLITIARSRKEE